MSGREEATTRRAASIGASLAAATALAAGTAHAVNAWALDREIGLLDAGMGHSGLERIGTLAIAVSTAAVALLALRWRSTACAVLASLLAFVLLDDTLGLHEHVPGWRALYVPVLAPIFLLLWRFEPGNTTIARPIRAGLMLLALSVVGGAVAERIVAHEQWGHADIGYEAKILIKDGSELAGWMLVATGLAAAALPEARR